ncbi:uncharacterized protein LOC142358489, partial [Convolutriloba macropyga]|uniref:uncharacterized protein LOC142358489 n=1 Tax=Convolutriloba macropyga TaxID=536237 RepID=UPI003F525A53
QPYFKANFDLERMDVVYDDITGAFKLSKAGNVVGTSTNFGSANELNMRVITSVRIFYTAPNNGHVCGVELLGEVMGCVNANSHQYTVGDGYEFAGFISLTSQDADTAGNYLLLPLQYGYRQCATEVGLAPSVCDQSGSVIPVRDSSRSATPGARLKSV